VRSVGDVGSEEAETYGHGEFLDHEAGVGGDDGGTDDSLVAIGEEFDEATAEVGGVTGFGAREGDEDFADFAIATDAIVFGGTDGGDLGVGASDTSEASVFDGELGAMDDVGNGGGDL